MYLSLSIYIFSYLYMLHQGLDVAVQDDGARLKFVLV